MELEELYKRYKDSLRRSFFVSVLLIAAGAVTVVLVSFFAHGQVGSTNYLIVSTPGGQFSTRHNLCSIVDKNIKNWHSK